MGRHPQAQRYCVAVRRLQSVQGSVILALLVITSIALLGTPLTTISLTESRLQTRATGDVTALSACDSGLTSVLWEYNRNHAEFPNNSTCTGLRTPKSCCLGPSYGCWEPVVNPALCPSASKTPNSGICRQSTTGQPFAFFQNPLVVTSGKLSQVTIFVDDVNGAMYGRQPTVTLNGHRQAPPQISTQVKATLGPVNSPKFDQPVRAGNPLFLGRGSVVDSYDRSLGPYGAATLDVSQPPYGVLNKSTPSDPTSWQGTVQTNSTLTVSPWAIQMNSNSSIYGDAIIGQAGDPAWAIDQAGGASVYGNKRVATPQEAAANSSQLAAISPFTVTPGANPVFTNSDCSTAGLPPFTVNAAVNNYSTIDVAQNCTVYVDVSGNQRLDLSRIAIGISGRLEFRKTVSGPATIDLYIANDFYVRDQVNVVLPADLTVAVHANDSFYAGLNSRVNATADALPARFVIEVSGGAANDAKKEVDFRADATILATVRAPSGEMNIGDRVTFYGAAVAKDITINQDTQVHYDISLQNTCQDPSCTNRGGIKTTLWKRPSF